MGSSISDRKNIQFPQPHLSFENVFLICLLFVRKRQLKQEKITRSGSNGTLHGFIPPPHVIKSPGKSVGWAGILQIWCHLCGCFHNLMKLIWPLQIMERFCLLQIQRSSPKNNLMSSSPGSWIMNINLDFYLKVHWNLVVGSCKSYP